MNATMLSISDSAASPDARQNFSSEVVSASPKIYPREVQCFSFTTDDCIKMSVAESTEGAAMQDDTDSSMIIEENSTGTNFRDVCNMDVNETNQMPKEFLNDHSSLHINSNEIKEAHSQPDLPTLEEEAWHEVDSSSKVEIQRSISCPTPQSTKKPSETNTLVKGMQIGFPDTSFGFSLMESIQDLSSAVWGQRMIGSTLLGLLGGRELRRGKSRARRFSDFSMGSADFNSVRTTDLESLKDSDAVDHFDRDEDLHEFNAPTVFRPSIKTDENNPSKSQSWTEMLSQKLSNRPELAAYTIIMLTASTVSLIGMDLYYLCLPPIAYDQRFLICIRQTEVGMILNELLCHVRMLTVMGVVLVLFILEFLSNCVVRRDFAGSFACYLDLLAIFALIPEIFPLWNRFQESQFAPLVTSIHLARAARTARICVRAARMVRIVFHCDIFSILSPTAKNARNGSLYSTSSQTYALSKKQESTKADTEMKVGSRVLEKISNHLMLIVGTMLFSTILVHMIETIGTFQPAFATPHEEIYDSLRLLTTFAEDAKGNLTEEPFKTIAFRFISDKNSDPNRGLGAGCPPANVMGTPASLDVSACTLRLLKVANKVIWGSGPESVKDLRCNPIEGIAYFLENSTSAFKPFIMDMDQLHTYPSARSMPYSIAVFSEVTLARYGYWHNIGTCFVIVLVLAISSMWLGRDVDQLVIAPLESMANMVNVLSSDPMAKLEVDAANFVHNGESETRMIATALIKLSAMVQIGFGEAGAAIIRKNLEYSCGDSIQSMVPGRRVTAIFGFCDVRNFTQATECLQENIMMYINGIAEILHKAVVENGGAPNKNIGDAWLLAWPITDCSVSASGENMKNSVQQRAACALRALVRAVVEIRGSKVLNEICNNEELQRRLPNYQTELGFGLHTGWAIEGAIGSKYKVDPSYLSPNVEIVQRLEGGTKHYGVSILMSDTFFDILPRKLQRLCRCIDRVKDQKGKAPMELYTYDIINNEVQKQDSSEPLGSGNVPGLDKSAPSFWQLHAPATTSAFRALFNQGLRHYFDGDWITSRKILEACLEECPKDRPCLQLLEVMDLNNNQLPVSWKGYREIASDSFEVICTETPIPQSADSPEEHNRF